MHIACFKNLEIVAIKLMERAKNFFRDDSIE
jgi:hypothetical protein